MIEPLLEFKNGRTRAKFHNDVNISKVFGIITGGSWEIENLSIVQKIIEEFALTSSTTLSGIILRPYSYLLREETDLNREILSVLEKIGEMFIREELIDEKDLLFVSQPLVNNEDYLKALNKDYLDSKGKLVEK